MTHSVNIQFCKIDGASQTGSFSLVPVTIPKVNGSYLAVGCPLDYTTSPTNSLVLVDNVYKVEKNTSTFANTWYVNQANSGSLAAQIVSGSYITSSLVSVSFSLQEHNLVPEVSTFSIRPVEKNIGWSGSFVSGEKLSCTTDTNGYFTTSLIPSLTYEVVVAGHKKNTLFYIKPQAGVSPQDSSAILVTTQSVASQITPQNKVLYAYTAEASDARYLTSTVGGNITASWVSGSSVHGAVATASYLARNNQYLQVNTVEVDSGRIVFQDPNEISATSTYFTFHNEENGTDCFIGDKGQGIGFYGNMVSVEGDGYWLNDNPVLNGSGLYDSTNGNYAMRFIDEHVLQGNSGEPLLYFNNDGTHEGITIVNGLTVAGDTSKSQIIVGPTDDFSTKPNISLPADGAIAFPDGENGWYLHSVGTANEFYLSNGTTGAEFKFGSDKTLTAFGITSSLHGTSSWASKSVTSSYSSTASYVLGDVASASYATTASYLLGGAGLTTGSTYPITASWSNQARTASYFDTTNITSSAIQSQNNGYQVSVDGATLVDNGNPRVNWHYCLLMSGSNYSLDWQNRLLIDATGETKASWGTFGLSATTMSVATTSPRGIFDVNAFTQEQIAIVTTGDANVYFNSGGNYYFNGSSYSFKVYAYRTVSGTRIYSPYTIGFVTFAGTDPNDTDNGYMTFSWNAVSGAEGYRVIIDSDPTYGASGDYYFDTTATNVAIGVSDIGYDEVSSQYYTSGNTVTPNSVDVGPNFYIEHGTGKVFNQGIELQSSPFVDDGTYITYMGGKNIGIGNASPTEALTVNGSIAANTFKIGSLSGYAGEDFWLGSSGANVTGRFMSTVGNAEFTLDARNTTVQQARINFGQKALWAGALGFDSACKFGIRTDFAGNSLGTSNALTINSASNVGIGVYSPVNRLDVAGNVSASVYSGSGFYARDMMRIPYSSSAQSLSPVVATGSMWFNSATNVLYIYNGTAWKTTTLT